MNEHSRKIIAPVIIVVFLAAYYGAITFSFISFAMSVAMIITVALVSLGITSVLIWVLIERIKEIKKGEEDDLSEY